jgi:hypothetical protein
VQREGRRSRGKRVYAGVGTRATPSRVLFGIEAAARRLARGGWTMRTGMSPGADQAFYRGAIRGRGHVELFLPWPTFEAQARLRSEGPLVYVLPEPAEEAYALAARFDPSWETLDSAGRRLRARDCHQVLGRDLASPVRLIVCWTPDGNLDGTGRLVGGTGQALRIARHYRVEVLNLARPGHPGRLAPLLSRSRA